MPCSLWKTAVLAAVARQAHPCFQLQCKNQPLEPMSGTGAGDLCAGHAMRGDVATSAGHSTCASEPGQEANLGDVVNDSLINAHCFPTTVLYSLVMSQDQVLQSVPFSQSLLIAHNRIISPWPDGRRDQKKFSFRLPHGAVVGKLP